MRRDPRSSPMARVTPAPAADRGTGNTTPHPVRGRSAVAGARAGPPAHERPAAARAWSRAASMPPGSRPPAMARSGFLPPPPPMSEPPSAISSPASRPPSLAGRGDQGGAAALRLAADDDGPDARLLAHGQGQLAQLVAAGAVDADDHDAVDGLAGQRGGLVAGGGLAQRLHLVTQGLELGAELERRRPAARRPASRGPRRPGRSAPPPGGGGRWGRARSRPRCGAGWSRSRPRSRP